MNSQTIIFNLIPAMWFAWALYWVILARNAKQTLRRESFASRATHVVPLVMGVLLVALPSIASPVFSTRILPHTLATYWTGVVLFFFGLAFAVWARVHIGSNWSGTVTVKKGHVLIRTGPYHVVRHPIYTGLLAAVLGSGVARGELRLIWALVLCSIGFTIKLRLEERWMRQEFGEEYARYSAEVPALVPFWPV